MDDWVAEFETLSYGDTSAGSENPTEQHIFNWKEQYNRGSLNWEESMDLKVSLELLLRVATFLADMWKDVNTMFDDKRSFSTFLWLLQTSDLDWHKYIELNLDNELERRMMIMALENIGILDEFERRIKDLQEQEITYMLGDAFTTGGAGMNDMSDETSPGTSIKNEKGDFDFPWDKHNVPDKVKYDPNDPSFQNVYADSSFVYDPESDSAGSDTEFI
ncbi:hypothetical protein MKW98_026859 [Papaver atlanticum]|uniref:Uncharacterized protein n=1 Tax=Papaver atlanticum TaxID=357466 RepID=A0AAD4S057_9MAGN|nr:hypothetical protein MKW98_026859 [Papaver atlanticum]